MELRVAQPPKTVVVPNEFSMIVTAQRRLQDGDNSLPFPERVKDRRERLYNDLLDLVREMGISCNAPLVYGAPFLKLCECLWYIH